MPNIPQSEALQAMLAAAQTGSLSGAAEELGLTHGAVSRRIQGLEAWLGEVIFERHGRGVTLTPAGEVFARRVERSLTSIENAAADLRASTRRDLVKVSILPSVARLWLMPRILELHGEPSDLVIAINCEHRLAMVESREADIAIRAGNGCWAGLRSELLFEEVQYPLASPEIAKRLEGFGPEAILREILLHDSDAAGWRRWFSEAGCPYRPRGGERRFDDYDLTLSAAVAGLGVALARDPLSRRHEDSGVLVRLEGPVVPATQSHFVVIRSWETREAVLRLSQRMLKAGQLERSRGSGSPSPSLLTTLKGPL